MSGNKAIWDRAMVVAEQGWTTATAAGDLAPSTRARYLQIWESLCRYATASGLSPTDPPASIERLISAPLRGGVPVSPATARLRLTVVRSAIAFLTADGLLNQDPTETVKVAHVPAHRVPVPLTPPEVKRLLASGRTNPSDTLRPATVALALAGAVHAEIARTVSTDLDRHSHRITLGQADRRRDIPLDPRLARVLEARVVDAHRAWRRRGFGSAAQVPIALSRPAEDYDNNALVATVGGNLNRALHHAGVVRSQVRPRSIREYAANRLYAATGSIEQLAKYLGLESLDTTRRLIDREWQRIWGSEVREASL